MLLFPAIILFSIHFRLPFFFNNLISHMFLPNNSYFFFIKFQFNNFTVIIYISATIFLFKSSHYVWFSCAKGSKFYFTMNIRIRMSGFNNWNNGRKDTNKTYGFTDSPLSSSNKCLRSSFL